MRIIKLKLKIFIKFLEQVNIVTQFKSFLTNMEILLIYFLFVLPTKIKSLALILLSLIYGIKNKIKVIFGNLFKIKQRNHLYFH
jgi:hypothetical protein